MTLGTTLFSTLSSRAFSRLDARISDLQAEVSSGKNDPRPSSDPVRAMRLSVAQEQTEALNRYATNLQSVTSRLDQSDIALSELNGIMQRFTEIAVRGASASAVPAERATLRIEAEELRAAVLDMANARDAMGRVLFGGFSIDTPPFIDGPDGVSYVGDRGQHMLRVSESATMRTGLDGGDVFMGLDTDAGRSTVFDVIDDLMFTLSSGAGGGLPGAAEGAGGLAFRPDPTRQPEAWRLDVTGPSGSATIEADIAAGAPGPLVDAINAQSAATGVTAALHSDGETLILTPVGPGGDTVRVSDVDVVPARRAALADTRSLDAAGQPTGSADRLVPMRLTTQAQIDGIGAAGDHFADLRARVGALGDVASRNSAAIENRKVLMAEAVAGLEDLDIAKALTDLQALLLTRDAAQQTFAKISTKSLFDYIR
ncbi:flagellar hook-associated protein 3 [Meridianimarinicoccus roseus]|jgi:flagellar hook-associated protein 3 FlgL|uniref:Flagellar hook-associated protein 3 n=1 Tax=Meridianimarinicoccus roseus TaxID=2072018 RepID=A0A2V2LGD4_9RHOB|nr:flagellar hook-associated protein FlgL [Meridianimarinicoccus roseus]PWR02564.1 flagellar hook-associated protein 3 [Meridianimarinicoccus roseus]